MVNRYINCFTNDQGINLTYKPIIHPKGAVIICPGGAYKHLSDREGEVVAEAFSAEGWQPFVLYYSTGENLGLKPLKELAWVISEVKRNAKHLKLEKKPVVVCGFSAGGHLAASLGVHWEEFSQNEGQEWYRPDALILCYPVITSGEFVHADSIEALVGKGDPSYFSLEHYIGLQTPPTFLWHTQADDSVPIQNSVLFMQGLIDAGVPMEAHFYPYGVHGLSLATQPVSEPEKGRLSDEHVAGWFDLCIQWLKTIKAKESVL